jgi:hypothetical protein
MARVIALAHVASLRFQQVELVRAAVVCGCALALILAETALPI